MTTALVIRRMTGEEVKRIDVTGRSERDVERITAGLLINMGEDFYVGEED